MEYSILMSMKFILRKSPVKANSYEEAVKKVEEMYKKKEIILELDDLTEYKIS